MFSKRHDNLQFIVTMTHLVRKFVNFILRMADNVEESTVRDEISPTDLNQMTIGV